MLDIIPSTSGGQQVPGGRRPVSRKRITRDDPAVVKLNWKLPARLRKPIAHELAKERFKQRQEAAIVNFERRPVITKALSIKNVPNRGAEYHTGDIYRHSQPQRRVALPPYAGRFARTLTPPSVPPKRKNIPARQAVPPIPKVKHTPVAVERDVPFNWPTVQLPAPLTEPVPLAPSTPTFSLPLSFSIWPISLLPNLFGKKKILHPPPASLKGKQANPRIFGLTKNLLILFAGCLLAGGLVLNLQTVGRGAAILSTVQDRAGRAYDQLVVAQSALAQTDFAGSEQAFAAAGEELQQAQKDFDAAFTASRSIVAWLDVTHSISSGQELLAAGEHLTEAGQHVSRGLAPLVDSTDYLPGPEGGDKKTETKRTLVDAINASRQEFTAAATALDATEVALHQVKSPLLPANVARQVNRLQEVVPHINTGIHTYLTQSQTLLSLLGAEREKQYLVVFANNHELRPVGGFLGSLALLNINRGRVENIDVQSVYDGDGQLKEFIAPPSPLLAITNRWYLRDANWFISYPDSAKKIAGFFEKEGGPTVDGVLLLTPEVIRSLLKITGPLNVPGYATTVSYDNFYEVTQSEVTYNYDKTVNKPKQFLSDLTPLLLNKLTAGETGSKIQILQALSTSVRQKDLLLYFHDQAVEQQVVTAGWGGALPEKAPGFLMINNANIGGHKSDQFMEQEADVRAQVEESGDVDVVLTIRRTHHGPAEALAYPYPPGEDPSKKDNVIYQRVVVPAGAELLESSGYTPARDIAHSVVADATLPIKPDSDVVDLESRQQPGVNGTAIGSESGYITFANWIITKPGQTTVTLYHYRLPNAASLPGVWQTASRYSLYIAKQPGQERSSVRASIALPSAMHIVQRVPEQGITQENDQTIIYRGSLTSDIVVGAVYDKL